MKNRRFLLIVVSCIIFVFTITYFNPVFAEKMDVITLSEVLESGIVNNPEIREIELDEKNADLDYQAARRERFPEIDISTTYTRLEDGPEMPSIEPEIDPNTGDIIGMEFTTEEGSKDQYSTQVSLQQPIYLGGRLGLGVDIADIGRELSEVQKRQKKSEVILEIIEAYYDVVLSQKRVEIEEEAVELAREQKRMAEANYQAGNSLETDLLQAEIEEGEAVNSLQEARNMLVIARKSLSNIAGIDDSSFQVVEPSIKPQVELNEEKLFSKAKNKNLQIEILNMNTEMLEKNFEMEKRSKYPNLVLQGEYGWQADEFYPDDGGSWSLTVALSSAIFDSGRSGIEREKLKNELKKMDERKDSAIDMIELGIENTLNSIRQKKDTIDLRKLQVENAEENLRLQNKRYEAGMGNILEVTAAQTVLNQTKVGLVQVEREYVVELYRLLQQTDELIDFYEEVILYEM